MGTKKELIFVVFTTLFRRIRVTP